MPIKFKREPSYLIKHKSYGYQNDAVKAVCDLEYAAIFHEQGLGKTKIAIDLMFYWIEKQYVDTILLVVKKSLIANWKREFGIHTHLTPKVLTQNRQSNYYAFNTPSRIVLCHFEVFKSEIERIKLFLKTRKFGIIIDESAKIKNPESELTKIYLELSPYFYRRVIMTGTPVANRPQDIWAQIWFLDHGKSLGNDYYQFKSDLDLSNTLYQSERDQSNYEENLSEIFDKISSFTVRETKNSGIINLPEKEIRNVSTEWETRQREIYNQIREEERTIILQEGIPIEDISEAILKRLLRLLQVTSNPKLIDSSYNRIPGKFEYLENLVKEINSKNEKCIVWTSFTDNVDFLTDELSHFGSCKVHGKISIDIRNDTIDRFLNDPDIKILVATPGAAKEGLTLTVANSVIFYDRGFSLDDYLQAQDRIHRISQEKKCYVYNLIMKNSIDEWVDTMLQSKELSAKLVQGDITKEYYSRFISYEFGEIIQSILKNQ